MTSRRTSSRLAGVIVALVAAAFALPAAAQSPDVASIRLADPQTGDSAPLGRGEPLLHIAFFATWCQDCVDEIDRLEEIEQRWGDRGYRLIVVAVQSRQSAERLTAFAERRQPPGRLAFDASGKLAEALNVQRLPTHVLLNGGGGELGRSGSVDEIARLVAGELDGPARGR